MRGIQKYIKNLTKIQKTIFYKYANLYQQPILNCHQLQSFIRQKNTVKNDQQLGQSYGIPELQKLYVNNELQHQSLTPQKFNNYNPQPKKNIKNQAEFLKGDSKDPLWISLKTDAYQKAQKEPVLESFFFDYIFNHKSLDSAMVFILANKMSNALLGQREWEDIFRELFNKNQELIEDIKQDLKIVETMDAAFKSHINTLLYFKGFHGLGLTRCAQKLYQNDRQELAFIIQNRTSELFGMDMHPGAKFEGGIFFDHAHGLVIGETATIGSGTVILHNVTLGATGKEPHGSDRHPKIGRNCYIGSNVSILGNLNIGNNVKIGAGSIVLQNIPDNKTCVGVPAKILGDKQKQK